jgi:hypothetical protein
MAQIFDRSSNSLTRFSLVLFGLILIGVGVTLNYLQRSPWVTNQGVRPAQPVPFSHKHHVQGLGLQCQYCHTSVEKSSYAGIPPTKTCMNCHAQIWTNADLLAPVRHSWATNESIVWTKVHDLPDFVYFNHSVHVNKGIGCSTCHGRIDQMPLTYQANTLQMEWCLNCHRNPAKNLRPTSEIYQMAWQDPSSLHPVWCMNSATKPGVPTAQLVDCTTHDPENNGAQMAALEMPPAFQVSSAPAGENNPGVTPWSSPGHGAVQAQVPVNPHYVKFTDQEALGKYLLVQYHIRPPRQLTSCDTCHR